MSRVLLLTNDFPPRKGGIQSYLESLVGELLGRGSHELTVYAPKWKGAPEYDKAAASGKGRHVCGWTNVRLPDSAEWGRWPLGGWNIALSWSKCPPTGAVCLEAIYTNPVGKIFRAQQGPIAISG